MSFFTRLRFGFVQIPEARNVSAATNFLRGYALDFSTGGTPDAKYFPQWGEELQKTLDSPPRHRLFLHANGRSAAKI